MVLWDYVPNKSSRKDIIQAMKENLELKEHTVIKEFSCSINKPYEKKIIGEGPYSNGFTYTLLPDFTGLTEAQARALASKYGVTVSFSGVSGTVVEQSEPAKRRIDKIKGTVNLKLSGTKKDDDEKDKKKKDDDECDPEKDKDCDKTDGKDKDKEKTDPVDPVPSGDDSDDDDKSETQPKKEDE
jgi:beta-lactam-binding protein with PASTA domain